MGGTASRDPVGEGQLLADAARGDQRADAYEPARGPVGAYVSAIAGSTVVDLQRRDARYPRPVEVTDAGAPAVDDAADRVLLAEVVRAALDRLTPEHRRVLELAYTRGLTQREVAAQLELPLGTVKSRTSYALKSFRLACEELGVRP